MKQSIILPISLLLCFTQLINVRCTEKNTISRAIPGVDEEIIAIGSSARADLTLDDLCGTIKFTPSGMVCFLKHMFNNTDYAEQVLPEMPFNHLEQLINHGSKKKLPRSYADAVFRLFGKKLKAAPYISAYETDIFLQKLPDLLKDYLAVTTKTQRKQRITRVVRTELETRFDFLKQDPDGFLDQLADKILALDDHGAADISREQLQNTVMRFIEVCLNKLVWNPDDKDSVWKLFMSTGKTLNTLKEAAIIRTTDDLDELLWTFINRFCAFLSLSGSDLPLSFYEKAQEDIQRGIAHLDSIAEQEDLIKTKRAYLQETILAGVAKSMARDQGLLTDTMVVAS